MREIHFAVKNANAAACKASPEFVKSTDNWKKVTCVDCRNRTPKPIKK